MQKIQSGYGWLLNDMAEVRPNLGDLVEIETKRKLFLGGLVPERSIGFARCMVFPPEERFLPSRISLSDRNMLHNKIDSKLPENCLNYKSIISCSILHPIYDGLKAEEALRLPEGTRVMLSYEIPLENYDRFIIYPGYMTGKTVSDGIEMARTMDLPSKELRNCWLYPLNPEPSVFILEEHRK